ncbi:MAG: MBL fold metallo-hydrolase [Saprospiraceae bacterium]
MKITLLGTGTSQGVPVIGCDCPVCRSTDSKDKRLRVSLLVENEGSALVVDVGPDFRQQMLRAKVKKLDAVLLTHEHNDHIVGLDDIRPFNFRQLCDMPIYCMKRVLNDLKIRFAYTFAESRYPGVPRFDWQIIDQNSDFWVDNIKVRSIGLLHGSLDILGFRFGDIAYCTDVKSVVELEKEKLKNLKVLIIGALHHEPHHAHMNLEEALLFIREIQPEQSYLTHISHHMGKTADVQLPAKVAFAYDGLTIEI